MITIPATPFVGGTLTSGLGFSPTNTLDIGTSATVLAPRTVYAGTSFVGPVGTFTTSVAVGGATIGTDAAAIAGTVTIAGGASLVPIVISSTDAGAALGPILDLYRNSASPAASDVLAGIQFNGMSSTGVKRTFGSIFSTLVTATNAAEDGSLTFQTMKAGTLTTALTLAETGVAAFAARITLPLGVTGTPAIKTAGAETGIYWRNTAAFDLTFSGTTAFEFVSDGSINGGGSAAGLYLNGSNGASANDVFLKRAGPANWQFGNAAVDVAIVAQSLSMQNVLAGGTSDIAGANFTLKGSQGKGSGVGGSIIFQTAPAGGSGTTVNALATVLTLNTTAAVVASGKNFQLGNNATTGLVAGALAALTTASIVIYDGTGTAYRVPCITP